ncbi:MAG TPA: hypothetical protein EYN00_07975 [Planctomycetes bacterium]|nr:hypothetical protein [Planctomycetota bacterium]
MNNTRYCWICMVFATGLLLFSIVGCQTMGTTSDPIEVVKGYQPDDIPVPYAFEFDENRSWAYLKFKDGPLPVRSIELVYWGDRPVEEVQNWYREQMPIHGWTFQLEDQPGGLRSRFTRGDEFAEILIKRTPDERGHHYVTRLLINVGVQ